MPCSDRLSRKASLRSRMSPSGRPPAVDQAPDPQSVVDVDGRDAGQCGRSLPHTDDRDIGLVQVLQQQRLVAGVADEKNGVAMPCLQHCSESDGFVRPAVGVAQDDVVAVPACLHRNRVDGAGEERVRDLADNDSEEHRPGAPQAASQWIRPIVHLAGHVQDLLAGGRTDRHGHRRAGQDSRHRALGDSDGVGYVLHRGRPRQLDRPPTAAHVLGAPSPGCQSVAIVRRA